MAESPAKAEQCEMIIGYLVPHRCEHPALGRCAKCGRGYCEEHVTVQAAGLLCLACQQGLAQPVALPLTAQTYNAADLATFAALSQWDSADDDPNDTFADLS
jgi:recombinational DNA repair protein (RecF pathway)